jgi:hypothetical protein
MNYTEEQITEAFSKVTPDSKTCLHVWKSAVIELDTGDDDGPEFGIIVRTLQHSIDGKLTTHDILIKDEVMAAIGEDLATAANEIIRRSLPSPADLVTWLTSAMGLELSTEEHARLTRGVQESYEAVDAGIGAVKVTGSTDGTEPVSERLYLNTYTEGRTDR